VALNEVDRLKAENKELKKNVGENGPKTELELQLGEASKARRDAEFGILEEKNKSLKKKELEMQQTLQKERENNSKYVIQIEQFKRDYQKMEETSNHQIKQKETSLLNLDKEMQNAEEP